MNGSTLVNQRLPSGIRCLLVEDDPICRYILTKFLKEVTSIIDACSDAESAFENIKAKTYDIIILDIGLPKKSGDQLALEVRQELNITVPIIATTGHVQEENVKNLLKSGITKVYSKPIQKGVLHDIIYEYCSGEYTLQVAVG